MSPAPLPEVEALDQLGRVPRARVIAAVFEGRAASPALTAEAVRAWHAHVTGEHGVRATAPATERWIALHVLGLLGHAQAERVETMLLERDDLREVERVYRELIAALCTSTPAVAPPPWVHTRLVASLGQERGGGLNRPSRPARTPARGAPRTARRRRAW